MKDDTMKMGGKHQTEDAIKISQKAQEVIDAYRENVKDSHSDVMGSYTGMSDEMGRPIQDADDM